MICLRVINIKSNVEQGVNEGRGEKSVQTRERERESASDYATLERQVN